MIKKDEKSNENIETKQKTSENSENNELSVKKKIEDIKNRDELYKSNLKDLFPTKEELLGRNVDEEFTRIAKSTEYEPYEKMKEDAAEQKEANKKKEEDEFSEIELKAMDQGWVPLNKYKGDPEDWVDANEWVNKSSLFKRINSQKREIKKMQQAYDSVLDLVKKQSEMLTEERAQKALQQKREAIQIGDVDSAEKYEEEYNKLKREMEGFKELMLKTKAKSEIPEEVRDFVDRNKEWYNESSDENLAMVDYANRISAKFEKQYPAWPLSKNLEETEKKVKEWFADKFENPNIRKQQTVETSNYKPKKEKPTITYDDLPDHAKKIVNNFVRLDRTGKMNREDYVKDLISTGAITL